MRKPEKEIYLYILKKLKFKPEECLIIDDNKRHLFWPEKLGMETIHFKSFSQLNKKLNSKLNERDQIVARFINLLKEIKIKSRNQRKFEGIGLVLYESKYLSKISHFNLRPSSQLISKKMKVGDFATESLLLKISEKNNPFHDGFHFFNERGVLTHISQYFVPPIRKIKPNESRGVRYHAALLGSYIKGVILTGVVFQDSKAYYFKKGKVYKV